MLNTTISNITKKRLLRTLIVTTAILFSLSCFVLSPLYTYMCADILFAATAMPEIIEIIIDITDIVTYALCFATIVYSIFKFSLKGSVSMLVSYGIAVFLKYSANLVVTFIFDGSVSPSSAVYVLLYFALDMIILLTVALSTASIFRKYNEKRNITKKANNALGKATPSIEEELFGGNKLFVRANPLHRSALLTGIVLSAIKIVTRILFDIAYGAPTTLADALWMIAYYVSDILIAVIVYAISVYMFTHFNSKEQKV